MKTCDKMVEFDNGVGAVDYDICGKPAKYYVEYYSLRGSKLHKDHVCGIHCNSLKKWADRLENLTGDRPYLKIEKLSLTPKED